MPVASSADRWETAPRQRGLQNPGIFWLICWCLAALLSRKLSDFLGFLGYIMLHPQLSLSHFSVSNRRLNSFEPSFLHCLPLLLDNNTLILWQWTITHLYDNYMSIYSWLNHQKSGKNSWLHHSNSDLSYIFLLKVDLFLSLPCNFTRCFVAVRSRPASECPPQSSSPIARPLLRVWPWSSSPVGDQCLDVGKALP